MDALLLEAFRYNVWANLRLLETCEKLTDEQLQLTAPGTYGTIGATLQHLLGAEQRYVQQLGGAEARMSERDEFPGVAALKEHAARSGDALIGIAERIKPEDSFERQFRGSAARVASGVVAIQALHHGNDHRTHVCTVLGQNDLEPPPIDVWAYGLANRFIVTVEPPGTSG